MLSEFIYTIDLAFSKNIFISGTKARTYLFLAPKPEHIQHFYEQNCDGKCGCSHSAEDMYDLRDQLLHEYANTPWVSPDWLASTASKLKQGITADARGSTTQSSSGQYSPNLGAKDRFRAALRNT